jgi:hypothetical protein
MNLFDAGGQAIALMKEHGLTARGWRFEWDNAVRRFGACHYSKRRISLSRELTKKSSEAGVIDTIKHEICHALVGHEAGHGPAWKAMAVKLGANPKRCKEIEGEQPDLRKKLPSVVTFPAERFLEFADNLVQESATEEPEPEEDDEEEDEEEENDPPAEPEEDDEGAAGANGGQAGPNPDVGSLLTWDAIRPEIESIYRVKLADDDPLRMNADVVRLVLMQSQVAAAAVLKKQVEDQLAGFNQSMDTSLKARSAEGHANIVKMLTVAQSQLKQAGVESQDALRDSVGDLVEAAKDLRSINRSVRTNDWLIGAIFMAIILLVGIGVGVMYARLSW